jgi:hypothetical protein
VNGGRRRPGHGADRAQEVDVSGGADDDGGATGDAVGGGSKEADRAARE